MGLDGALQLAASSFRASDGGAAIVLTEEMMTIALREGLGRQLDEQLDMERAQVAVAEEYEALEIFLPLKAGAEETALRLYVRPRIEDGDVEVEVVRTVLGNLPLPDVLAANRVESALNTVIDGQLARFQDTFTLVDTELTDAGLEIQLSE